MILVSKSLIMVIIFAIGLAAPEGTAAKATAVRTFIIASVIEDWLWPGAGKIM